MLAPARPGFRPPADRSGTRYLGFTAGHGYAKISPPVARAAGPFSRSRFPIFRRT
ncbi:hypothetical protein FTUN_1852 [Frigoriglobus tundricola]|uniref:Uncharacterized protein n=1 Tax=Frigoriglobus tundricola TaxID=2774151 RepID=A0A6M5YN07_9BACT|nr:hypothetical protein FTUN_1852 [Frigoriglobus tundricola]